jgi:hypothetical protein
MRLKKSSLPKHAITGGNGLTGVALRKSNAWIAAALGAGFSDAVLAAIRALVGWENLTKPSMDERLNGTGRL